MARSQLSPLPTVAVLVGVSALLWLAVPRLPSGPGMPVDPTGSPAPAAAVTSPDETAPLDRQQVLVERFCRGRCIDALDGRPLPGLSAELGEARTTTDRDGGFVIRMPDQRPAGLRITGGDVVPVERLVAAPDASRGPFLDLELGELPLRHGGHLSGWLLDASRQPQANATLVAMLAQPRRQQGLRECFATTATTGADGAFRFADPLPAGELVLALQDGTRALANARCQLAAGEATQVTLLLAEVVAAERVVGVLVGADGQPVVGARVQGFADRRRAAAVRAMGTSDAQGRFVLTQQNPDEPPLWPLVQIGPDVVVPLPADGGGDACMPWGAHELHFVVPPLGGPQLDGPELVVVDAEDGTPIERFAVRWQLEASANEARPAARRSARTHPGGRCRVGGAAVPHTLVVWPEDPRWLPSWRHAVVAGPGEPIVVSMPRAADFVVTVRTRSGRPVPQAHVELLRRPSDGVVHELATSADPGFGPHDALRLVETACDANGTAVLRWWRDPEPRTLRLTGPGLALDLEVVLATDPLDVVVPDTGRVRFRLQGAGGSFVTMQSRDGGHWPPPFASPIALDDRGEGVLELPVGTYDVSLATPTPDGQHGRATTLGSFATLTVSRGDDVELVRDLRDLLQPARLSAVLLVDGEPRPIRLWGRSGAASDSHRLPTTFQAGASHFDALPAGSYRPFVRLSCGGQVVDWPLADWTTLPPRASVQLGPFLLRTTALELQLEDRSGAPVTEGLLLLRGPTGGALAARPDAHGLVRLSGVPAVRCTLQFRSEDDDRELGSIDVDDPPGRRRFVVDR